MHPSQQPLCTCKGKIYHRVGRASGITETSPNTLVAASRSSLAEIGEAQAGHVGQQSDIGGNHHRGLAGTVAALQRSDMPIEEIALVEDTFPID
ncbi:hypothetical protein D9M70_569600 [compost metagenome]